MHPADRDSPVLHILYLSFLQTRIFSDLKFIILWLIGAITCIYVPILNETSIRVLLALPLVLFIPGYALIAALFPTDEDLDLIERIALSFGLSIAVVPLIGLGLNYTPWGIRLDPIVISLSLFTIIMVLIAQGRRAMTDPDDRYQFPADEIMAGIREEFFPTEGNRTDKILSIILLISILAAIGTTIFVIVFPKEGEKFTEFYILGEKRMAADYPDRLFIGEEYSMYIGVGNHEYRNVSYTIEVHQITMETDESGNVSYITRMNMTDRLSVAVPHNETVTLPYNLTAADKGYNRIEFLLFNESVPDRSVWGMERINQSYRDLHLWVKVLE
ncbi:Protein of unknown function DUF1616 [Methanospirillum hungatei JF-1]|uniref:DUF1616 domain-containing protein n=1 Tax=Methanospirillum hungatei JF-1 (strain ATCC 27890 / DSM 864 / NBRC 100397 / JF-1) TaxID=323259 RepID=Q2FN02_METHJ|nr:DUF1616 domain-containing protein [Methanospirillum hungatei]ABD40174.1 Protein of unknown function DUF1616 [Methanospirillum hungatei JF-1]